MRMNEEDRLLALDNQLCFKLYAASRAVTRAYRPLLDALGITYPQYLVLLVLWEWERQPPSVPSIKELGERLLLDTGTLTPLLKRLETRGLITRRRSRSDEREVLIALTAEGRALKGQAARLPAQLLCDARISAQEAARLREQLAKLLQALAA
jgi:MarR family transcriptional regulator, organic hydroperoxide resistance regulator